MNEELELSRVHSPCRNGLKLYSFVFLRVHTHVLKVYNYRNLIKVSEVKKCGSARGERNTRFRIIRSISIPLCMWMESIGRTNQQKRPENISMSENVFSPERIIWTVQ